MATETSNTIDIYGLTDWNEMVKVASASVTSSTPEPKPPLSWSPITPVGGTIFFTAEPTGRVYEFFDASGNLIENVQVGDRPYSYRVAITEDAPTSDCYYVYYDDLAPGVWAPDCVDSGTSEYFGTGRENTYNVSPSYEGDRSTIWYLLRNAMDSKVGGCDDWFIPSKGEIEQLRLTIESGAITGGTIAGSSYDDSVFSPGSEYPLWSSSEHPNAPDVSAWIWNYEIQEWIGVDKNYDLGFAFLVRSF